MLLRLHIVLVASHPTWYCFSIFLHLSLLPFIFMMCSFYYFSFWFSFFIFIFHFSFLFFIFVLPKSVWSTVVNGFKVSPSTTGSLKSDRDTFDFAWFHVIFIMSSFTLKNTLPLTNINITNWGNHLTNMKFLSENSAIVLTALFTVTCAQLVDVPLQPVFQTDPLAPTTLAEVNATSPITNLNSVPLVGDPFLPYNYRPEFPLPVGGAFGGIGGIGGIGGYPSGGCGTSFVPPPIPPPIITCPPPLLVQSCPCPIYSVGSSCGGCSGGIGGYGGGYGGGIGG